MCNFVTFSHEDLAIVEKYSVIVNCISRLSSSLTFPYFLWIDTHTSFDDDTLPLSIFPLAAGYRNRDCRIERVILHRDHNDRNPRTRGFGLYVTGGKLNDFDGRLYAYVSWVIPSSPADKMGLKPGDKILEWDAKCLINCTYEQVVSIMDSSATSAELIIEPLNRE